MKYKIAIVGYGSIARRHVINLQKCFLKRNISGTIDLIRSGKGQPIEKEIQPFVNNVCTVEEEIADDYDIMFITNPTSLHYETIKRYLSKTKHMFIEKPVFHTIDVDYTALDWKQDGVYYVACPMRYHKAIRYLKEHLDVQRVYSVRTICSSYLPEWRPESDYRESYSAKRQLGGGVSIDLIHEWDYLVDLFGFPEKVLHVQGKYSDLEIETEDLSVYIGCYPDKIIELHLDYFGRKSIRRMEIFMRDETILVDLLEGTISYEKSGQVISFEKDRDDYQMRELEDFFDMVEGKKKNTNSMQHAYEVLKLVTK